MKYRSEGKRLRTIAALAMVFVLLLGLAGTGVVAHEGAGEKPEQVEVLIGFHQPPGRAERSLVRRVGGEISRQFHIVDVISARMAPQAADALAQDARVRYVEPNGPVYALGQTVPWGIDRVFGDEEHDFPTWETTRGAGMAVAVLDTGIDENHEDLTVVTGTNTIDNTDWGSDGYGHGTHVAGTVAALDNEVGVVGVGPDIDLYAVKVLDDDGGGTWESVTAGIEWAVDQGVPVLNMSLGGGESETLQNACDAAYKEGHLLVAAAGNEGNRPGKGDNVGYPAAYESVIAVAASDENDKRASFSSTGPAVELIAPGESILSTVPGDGYEKWSGTSMASPHAAGAAALAWSANTGLSNAGIRGTLQETAEDLGLEPNHQGYGLVRADLAVAAAAELAPATTGNVEGTVTDSTGGDSIQGATVAVEGTNLSDTTDDQGYYLLEGVPTGEQQVTASADGYDAHTETVTVTEDVTVTQDFALEPIPTYTVSGTVKDADGNPLDGAVVTVEQTGQSDTTDSNGEYAIAEVEEGTYDITANKDGYESETQTVKVDQNRTVDFSLSELTGGTIRVQIADGGDDVNSGCSFKPSANEVYFGLDEECDSGYWAGFRFTEVKIPQGATITNAYVEFTVDGLYNNDLTVELRGEDTGDAKAFSSDRQPHTVVTTTNYVQWEITDNWKSGTLVNSPDIASVVQEIVNREDWGQGNDLIIIGESLSWKKTRTSHRRIFAYERDPQSAAVLVVEFELNS